MRQVRSIFLSDIHLETKACQAEHLLEFLKEYSSEYVFLLGDIVDLWSISRGGVHWSSAQNTFVQ
jgi:UDP-2,3-diacylglucosamine pyrophosphatase LpxH